jgi:branched-chain amino acid transport system permease protein
LGTLFGPVAGAFFMVTLENYLTTMGQWVFVVQGVIFVVCVMLFRHGFIGEIARLLRVKL